MAQSGGGGGGRLKTLFLSNAHCQHHSTETALLKVKNNLLVSMDKGRVIPLALLDLSSAFDTVYHQILLNRLQASLSLCGKALSWFEFYLKGRS